MTATPNHAQVLQQRTGAAIITGPWPTYSAFRDLPQRERWALYGSAKAYREALELQGFQMAETYDAFVRRVTEELDL
ncbi:hypothetical protein F7234_03745 [Pseudomonas putida]|uniref:hypothetical protein n=1 Tax=Pseudomonas putida TaxID=303 RepID=UPI00125EF955|nr:hypothetical protein [Pseudomonas putida]KAB5626261.1 hypothetical protein F7234_03745 [Pseudomonas putida]